VNTLASERPPPDFDRGRDHGNISRDLSITISSCPGRVAAFFTLLRRTGTYVEGQGLNITMDPGLAAHHAAVARVLRSIRGRHRLAVIPGRECNKRTRNPFLPDVRWGP
jgi:hypothetical protein